MGKFAHMAGHLALIAVGAVAAYAGLVPGKYAPIAVAAQGLAQAILAYIAAHKGK